MAIAFNTNSTALGSGGSGSFSVSGSPTNTAAIVWIIQTNAGDVTAVSVAGIAGTKQVENAAIGGAGVLAAWSVPLGSVTGSIAWVVTGSHFDLNVSVYSGVNQTTPVLLATGTTATSNHITCTQTPTVDGCWAVAGTFKNGVCAVDSLTNITNRYDTASANGMKQGDSNGTITNGVAYSQTVTSSGCSQNHSMWQLLIQPPAVGPVNVKTWDAVTQSTGIKTYKEITTGNVKSVNGVT